MRTGIRTKILGGFLLVILLAAGVTFYSNAMSERALKVLAGKSSIFVAEEISKRITHNIYLKVGELQGHAIRSFFQETLQASNLEFEKQGDIKAWIAKQEREWVSAPGNEITLFMRGLIDNKLAKGLRSELIEFHERKYGNRCIAGIVVVNRYGAVVAETSKTAHYRQDDQDWWQMMRKDGFCLSNLSEGETGEDPYGVFVGIKVENKMGEFAGAIKAVLTIKGIVREAEIASKRYETTRVKLITRNGRLIYSTKAFKFMEDVSHKTFFKEIIGAEGAFVVKYKGRERLYSYWRSRDYRGLQSLGWIVVVGHDTDEILAPVIKVRNRVLGSALVFIALSVLISFFINRSITRSVSRLIEGAREFGRGNLEYRIQVKSRDEMGELGTAFNEMAAERKEAEDGLRVSEETIRKSFESAAIGMVIVDLGGRFLEVNRAMCQMVGYSEEELLERDFQSITHPDDLGKDLNYQGRLLKEDIQYYHTDKRYIHRQGHEVWAHAAVSLLRDEKGNPIHLIGQIQDITETRQAQSEIFRQGALLTAINRVFRGALTCETEYDVGVICLDVAEELTGSKFSFMGELNPEGFFDTVAIRDPGWEACTIPRSASMRMVRNMKVHGIYGYTLKEEKSRIVNDPASHPDRAGTPEGHPRITAFLGVPLKSGEKTIGMIGLANKEGGYDQDDKEAIETLSVAFVEALQDKRNELELAKYRHHLEGLVKTRTAALERSNQELEQFAYVASHDLQEPLRKVRAFGDRFITRYGDQVDEKGRDYLTRMQGAGRRMATMIEDLLSLSRVTTQGKNFVPVNLMKEAQQVLSDLEVTIDECGGVFEIGELPTIEGDPPQIRQLLLNLISNAFKYRKPGVSPLVRIHAAMMESEGTEGGGLCRIHVEDDGIGFEEKYADRIFQPFQRLHGRSEYEGTGMGLAICRKIAERHDGSISARSVPGQGATFIVTLPVRQKKEESKHG